MNKRILMGALFFVLSGCASIVDGQNQSLSVQTSPVAAMPKLDPFTDQEISSMDDVSFCNAFHTFALVGGIYDARMYVVQRTRDLNCEAVLSCTKQGFKRGSKKGL